MSMSDSQAEAPIESEPTSFDEAPILEPDPTAVSFVVPASAYDSIATDDELARPSEPYAAPVVAYAEPDLAPALLAVETLGRSLGEKLDALATRFDREIRAESTREKVVDRLHAELQDYKQGLLLSAMRPVFVDLIQLHDDVGKMVLAASEGDDRPRFADLIRVVQEGIEDILYRQGVEPFREESDLFDARRQRAVSTVATDDPALARRVADRLRKGFASGDKVVRPEVVSVYVVRAAATTDAR